MITLVIPAKNEAKFIGGVIKDIKKQVKQLYEIVVIDDGSTDGTGQIAKRLGAKVVRHETSQGGVVGSDYKHFKGDPIISLDADGEHNPKDIEKFAAALKTHDMVIGVRNYRSRIMEPIIETIVTFPVKDFFDGYTGFRRKWIALFEKYNVRLVWESHFVVWKMGGKMGNVVLSEGKRNVRPSRFGGAIKGNWKTFVRYVAYASRANEIARREL